MARNQATARLIVILVQSDRVGDWRGAFRLPVAVAVAFAGSRVWRIQCAMAATPLPQRNPTEDQVEAGFSRFKRAIGCSEAQEMLDLGNGPKAAAIAAVAHAHGTSVTVVESQLRSLRARRDHQRREHAAILEEDQVTMTSFESESVQNSTAQRPQSEPGPERE